MAGIGIFYKQRLENLEREREGGLVGDMLTGLEAREAEERKRANTLEDKQNILGLEQTHAKELASARLKAEQEHARFMAGQRRNETLTDTNAEILRGVEKTPELLEKVGGVWPTAENMTLEQASVLSRAGGQQVYEIGLHRDDVKGTRPLVHKYSEWGAKMDDKDLSKTRESIRTAGNTRVQELQEGLQKQINHVVDIDKKKGKELSDLIRRVEIDLKSQGTSLEGATVDPEELASRVELESQKILKGNANIDATVATTIKNLVREISTVRSETGASVPRAIISQEGTPLTEEEKTEIKQQKIKDLSVEVDDMIEAGESDESIVALVEDRIKGTGISLEEVYDGDEVPKEDILGITQSGALTDEERFGKSALQRAVGNPLLKPMLDEERFDKVKSTLLRVLPSVDSDEELDEIKKQILIDLSQTTEGIITTGGAGTLTEIPVIVGPLPEEVEELISMIDARGGTQSFRSVPSLLDKRGLPRLPTTDPEMTQLLQR